VAVKSFTMSNITSSKKVTTKSSNTIIQTNNKAGGNIIGVSNGTKREREEESETESVDTFTSSEEEEDDLTSITSSLVKTKRRRILRKITTELNEIRLKIGELNYGAKLIDEDESAEELLGVFNYLSEARAEYLQIKHSIRMIKNHLHELYL
jgi:hypothetical protein